jgi:hypothetical protein
MNKQFKQLVQLANQCVEIAKENQFSQGTRNDFNNENVKIGIYNNDNFTTMSIYFSPKNEWRKEIEVALYSETMKIPYQMNISEINTLIGFYTEFVNDYLGINKQEMAEKLKAQNVKKLHDLKMQVNELSIEIKNAENENN